MDASLLFKGMIVGFGIAAPVGPIGLLCIQRTLRDGRAVGLASGLGAATADGLYGLVAAFGLTLVTTFLVEQRLWFGLVGGLFLLYLGMRTLLSQPAKTAAVIAESRDASGRLAAAYGSTFLLTLTNPMTILSFVAIFAGAGLAAGGAGTSAAWMVAGVFAGSAAWWLLLSGGVSLLRHRFTQGAMLWVNRGAGLLITGFGLFALLSTWSARA